MPRQLILSATILSFLSILSLGSAQNYIYRKNLLGVANFKTATFQYMGVKPSTFIYGETANNSIVDDGPMFYFMQSEKPKEQSKSKKGPSSYQLRTVDDLLLLIYDEGVLVDQEDYDLSFSYVSENGEYTEVFLHNAMDDLLDLND